MLYTCKVVGCKNAVHKIGALFHFTRNLPTSEMCNKHRMAFRRYGNPLGKQPVKQTCRWCNKEFEKKRKARYCSRLCNNKGVSQERTANGKNRESVIRFQKKNPKKARDIWLRYKNKLKLEHPEKLKARNLSQHIPMQPCLVCDTTNNIHRHHHNYNKPKEVVFLCKKHHEAIHSW